MASEREKLPKAIKQFYGNVPEGSIAYLAAYWWVEQCTALLSEIEEMEKNRDTLQREHEVLAAMNARFRGVEHAIELARVSACSVEQVYSIMEQVYEPFEEYAEAVRRIGDLEREHARLREENARLREALA